MYPESASLCRRVRASSGDMMPALMLLASISASLLRISLSSFCVGSSNVIQWITRSSSIAPNSEHCIAFSSISRLGCRIRTCMAPTRSYHTVISPSLEALSPEGVMPVSLTNGMPHTAAICSCDCACNLSRPASVASAKCNSSVSLLIAATIWLLRVFVNICNRVSKPEPGSPPSSSVAPRSVANTGIEKLLIRSLTALRVRSHMLTAISPS